MGHPRLGEMMSRQRLCDDVLLTPLMPCRPLFSSSFIVSRRAQTKRRRARGVRALRCAAIQAEQYLQNNLNVLHHGRNDPLVFHHDH